MSLDDRLLSAGTLTPLYWLSWSASPLYSLPLVLFSLLELSRYPAFRFSEISRVIPRLGIARHIY